MSFRFAAPNFYTKALVTARRAGQFTGRWRMICPKGFPERGLEYLVTFRAYVFYMIKLSRKSLASAYPPHALKLSDTLAAPSLYSESFST